MKSQPLPYTAQDLRRTFKRALAKKGIEAVLDQLTPEVVAKLSCHQVTRILFELDEEKYECSRSLNSSANDNNGPIHKRMNALEAKQNAVNFGAAMNPDVRAEYRRLQKIVAHEADKQRGYVWRGPRQKLDQRIGHAFDTLVYDHTDFFRLHTALTRVSDDALRDAGMLPLGFFWTERLKYAMFPPLKPLVKRITLHMPDPEDENYFNVGLSKFHTDVLGAIGVLPPFISRFLEEFGYDINLAERLGHIDPDYATNHMTSDGRSFEDSAKGVHSDSTSVIDLPLFFVKQTEGQMETLDAHTCNDDLQMTLTHEALHGIDRQLGYFSKNSRDMACAYQKDLTSLRDMDLDPFEKRAISYFRPVNDGGKHESGIVAKSEAFAEIGAELALSMFDDAITPYFSSSAQVTGVVIETLRFVYTHCPNGFVMLDPNLLMGRSKSNYASPLAPSSLKFA